VDTFFVTLVFWLFLFVAVAGGRFGARVLRLLALFRFLLFLSARLPRVALFASVVFRIRLVRALFAIFFGIARVFT
jgi:hypothetical protein